MSLFKKYLRNIVDPNHELCILARKIDWPYFDNTSQELYCENNGRPSIPTRIMVGLHYLKYAFNESDESVVAKYRENPYWQYFCGLEEFKNETPCDPGSLAQAD